MDIQGQRRIAPARKETRPRKRRRSFGLFFPRPVKGSIAAALNLKESFAGRLSIAIEPVFKPLGFDWKLVTGMIGSFAAKEVFVAQMGIVHSLGESGGRSESLREDLSRNYSSLAGVSLILFLLIATPCMATVAVTRRESGKWKWAALQFFGLTVLAYIISLVVYQGGLLLGFG